MRELQKVLQNIIKEQTIRNRNLTNHGAIPVQTNQKFNQIKKKEMTGKKVIIRGDRSGVFFGILAEKNGREVKLTKCRRLWYWSGAASLSQLAVDGVANPDDCKFTVTVDEIVILDAIEIIPCTVKAINSIEETREWKV